MLTTTTPKKANNQTHFNGFPNLNTIPENLQSFFCFIRKQNPDITVEYNACNSIGVNNTHKILISYPKDITINCMALMDQIPTAHFRILSFSHKEYNNTNITLIER